MLGSTGAVFTCSAGFVLVCVQLPMLLCVQILEGVCWYCSLSAASAVFATKRIVEVDAPL